MRSTWKIPFYTQPVGSFLPVRGQPWAFQVDPHRRVHLYTGATWQNTRIRYPMLRKPLCFFVQSYHRGGRTIRLKFARLASKAGRKKTLKKK